MDYSIINQKRTHATPFKITYGDCGGRFGHSNRGNIAPPKRREIRGWSSGAIARLRGFLFSVVIDKNVLTGFAYEFTGTFGDCPPTPAAMHKCRDKFIKRLCRKHMARLVWVCEFQRRGVPHFHFVIYFHAIQNTDMLITDWLAVTSHFNTLPVSQSCKKIHALRGYFEYMTKHTSKGLKHYQRERKNMPKEWQGFTGRLWGKTGNFTTHTEEHYVTMPIFARFRNLWQQKQLAALRQVIADGVGSHFSAFSFRGCSRRKRKTLIGIAADVMQFKHGKKSLHPKFQQFKRAFRDLSYMRRIKKRHVPASVYNKGMPKQKRIAFSVRRSGFLFGGDLHDMFYAAIVFRRAPVLSTKKKETKP